MATSAKSLRGELVSISHLFYARGWSLATSSNFSARLDPGHILITASGKDKGNLKDGDIVEIDLMGGLSSSDSQVKPSAETYLHAELYRHDPEIGAVLHTHSVYATGLSEQFAKHGRFELSGYEMLKALRGVLTHEHTEIIPIFPNHQDMTALSKIALDSLRVNREIHSFLIERHGLYTWGRDLAEAKRHIEALEFLFECECRKAYNMDSEKSS
jgi:methylthioribulose-1-phosphate dehydratase